MIEYRPFRNDDPPALVRLWNTAGLGRGAAQRITPDAFDLINFSQSYFDRNGLIVAVSGGRPIAFVHAGFAFESDHSRLSERHGVICAVVVDPAFRLQGVGRELVRRAESYLRDKGAQSISAGPAPGSDPFYVGLYGGIQPAGFLESDSAAAPFFQAIGYAPGGRHLVFHRTIPGPSDPVNFRLIGIRRKFEALGTLQGAPRTWAWTSRFGRLETIDFLLLPKGKAAGLPVAQATLIGLDLYLHSWQQRAVGLIDICVPEKERRKGYAQALLLDISRKLRDEMITCIEVHASENAEPKRRLLESCGFQQVDAGVEYVCSRSAA